MRNPLRRDRPFGSLLLGGPDESMRVAALRVRVLLAAAFVMSNLVGAAAVFSLAAFVVPSPSIEDESRILTINLVAAGAYLLLALLVGFAIGIRTVQRRIAWALDERAPDEREQRAVLRLPLILLAVQGTLWGLAALVFGLFNAFLDVDLLTHVPITVGLSGMVTCAFAYLLAEFALRPIAARALASGAPERLGVPGVTARALLAWGVGSAIPVLGLMLVALSVLTDREVSATRLSVTVLVLGGIAITVGLLLSRLAARATSDPVRGLRTALLQVERGDLGVRVPVYDGTEVGLLQAGFNRMVAGLAERERLRDLFGRHVGEDVARAALERDVELGGEVRDVAVLFTDVIGSTALAARRPPTEVVEALNHFFGVVVEVVDAHGGSVNKFEGDGALAVFGAPVEVDDPECRALQAARELRRRLRDEVTELEACIGVAAGPAVAGNVGAEARFEYTVIGDPVNEAARLTELAKGYDGRVLASSRTVDRAGDAEAAHWELRDEQHLRGRAEVTRIAVPRD